MAFGLEGIIITHLTVILIDPKNYMANRMACYHLQAVAIKMSIFSTKKYFQIIYPVTHSLLIIKASNTK